MRPKPHRLLFLLLALGAAKSVSKNTHVENRPPALPAGAIMAPHLPRPRNGANAAFASGYGSAQSCFFRFESAPFAAPGNVTLEDQLWNTALITTLPEPAITESSSLGIFRASDAPHLARIPLVGWASRTPEPRPNSGKLPQLAVLQPLGGSSHHK